MIVYLMINKQKKSSILLGIWNISRLQDGLEEKSSKENWVVVDREIISMKILLWGQARNT
jgi:hypothetical protein